MTRSAIRCTIADLSIAASMRLTRQRNDRKGGEADIAAAKELDPDVVQDFAAVAAK